MNTRSYRVTTDITAQIAAQTDRATIVRQIERAWAHRGKNNSINEIIREEYREMAGVDIRKIN